MATQTQDKPKQTRVRAYVRSYDYEDGIGVIKDANTNTPLVEGRLAEFPAPVLTKLALTGFMALVAGAGVDAVRAGADGTKAMEEVIADLKADKVEFRDGVGIAMGGTLKKIARALAELDYTFIKGPDGKEYRWSKGNIAEAFEAIKAVWDIPADKNRERKESGRTFINKVQRMPEVAAKLLSYSKKAAIEEGALG